jgi:hypothetical protein
MKKGYKTLADELHFRLTGKAMSHKTVAGVLLRTKDQVRRNIYKKVQWHVARQVFEDVQNQVSGKVTESVGRRVECPAWDIK